MITVLRNTHTELLNCQKAGSSECQGLEGCAPDSKGSYSVYVSQCWTRLSRACDTFILVLLMQLFKNSTWQFVLVRQSYKRYLAGWAKKVSSLICLWTRNIQTKKRELTFVSKCRKFTYSKNHLIHLFLLFYSKMQNEFIKLSYVKVWESMSPWLIFQPWFLRPN